MKQVHLWIALGGGFDKYFIIAQRAGEVCRRPDTREDQRSVPEVPAHRIQDNEWCDTMIGLLCKAHLKPVRNQNVKNLSLKGIHEKIQDLPRSYERKNIPYEHFIDVVHQWHQNRE